MDKRRNDLELRKKMEEKIKREDENKKITINLENEQKDFKIQEEELNLKSREMQKKEQQLNEDINTLNNNKTINNDKKVKVQQFLSIFTKKYKERMNIKIDLVDSKGEKVNINSKGDTYANEYLIEKTVYELHSFNIPQKGGEDDNKDSKKNTKKDFKKDDKKKDKENKENKDEPKEIELVLEPVKIDGYCFRTVKEDQNVDDTEKAGGKDKKGAKKK